MADVVAQKSIKKLVIFGTLFLLLPIFLVSMAFLAVSSDAKNQEMYKQQQAEMIARIKAKEQAQAEQATSNSNPVAE